MVPDRRECFWWKSELARRMLRLAGGALTLWMCILEKDHLGQIYFTFIAGFVRFRSAAEAPRAKSESAALVEGHFGHFSPFPLFLLRRVWALLSHTSFTHLHPPPPSFH